MWRRVRGFFAPIGVDGEPLGFSWMDRPMIAPRPAPKACALIRRDHGLYIFGLIDHKRSVMRDRLADRPPLKQKDLRRFFSILKKKTCI